jgi:integrase
MVPSLTCSRRPRTDHPALHAFFWLAVSTDARRGQLCALQWRDIDLDRGTVAFARALAAGRAGGVVVVPTKNRRRNCVEIDEHTLAAVRRHHQLVAAGGRSVESCAFVFSRDSAGSSPWRPNWITKQFIRIRDGVGLVGCRLHDLRHFMATDMLAAGVPIPVVSARLDHARSSTTLNVYAHAIPGGDRDAANALAALVAKAD